jgi:hypothetical protein
VDIVVSPKKRARRTFNTRETTSTPDSQSSSATSQQGRSVKFTAQDFRAAHLLLTLNQQNDHLTMGPNGPVGGQHLIIEGRSQQRDEEGERKRAV